MLQSSVQILLPTSIDWIDFLVADTSLPMMDITGVDQHTESETATENEYETVNLGDDSDVPLRITRMKHRLPTIRVPNGCMEILHVHLQHVNEERRKLRMTS